jgi:ribose transport system permease protein
MKPEDSASRDLERAIGARGHDLIGQVLALQGFWVLAAALLAAVILSFVTDTFATPQNLFNVTRNFAFVAVIAIGMTTVIITGGIDLSVGSTLCLAAMVTGVVLNAGHSVWVGIAAGLAAALAVGLVNGLLISYVRIPPFVATLGMLSIARSLAMVASQNKMVYQFGPDHDLFLWLGGGSTLGIPNPVLVLAACCVVVGFALRWTRWGARIMAVGGNEKAAILTGLPVKRIKIGIYMLSAFMAGLTGVLEASWLGGVTTNLGQSMELSVIAAAVIGGANLMGGSGTILGAVVGAALIEIIRNSLTLLGISTFWQGTFVGTFIVVAVAFDSMRSARRSAAG